PVSMNTIRRTEISGSSLGLALAGGMGIVAIAVAAGGTRAEIPAAALLAVVLGRLAIPLVARWPVMVGAAILVDLLIPEDGRYQVSAGVGFQLQPYRVIVAILLLGWCASLLADPRVRARMTSFEGPLGLILFATLGSEAVNAGRVS